MNTMNFFSDIGFDLIAVILSLLIIAAYYGFLWVKTRENPTYTIHGVNALARAKWVEAIMKNHAKDIMAVQTLRNFIMGSSLMASTAALLIIGTLTLSGQAENISHSWHILSLPGPHTHTPQLWILKVMLLLVDFIVAFFSFAMSVRLTNHVVFMINVPEHDAHHNLSPQAVAKRLNRSGHMFAVGMRAFFFAVPLVFWLFGPHFLVLSTIGLVIALHHMDRSEPESLSSSAAPREAGLVADLVSAEPVHTPFHAPDESIHVHVGLAAESAPAVAEPEQPLPEPEAAVEAQDAPVAVAESEQDKPAPETADASAANPEPTESVSEKPKAKARRRGKNPE